MIITIALYSHYLYHSKIMIKNRNEIRRKYLPLRSVAKKLGVDYTTIYKWIKKDLFPKPVKVGRYSYYPKDMVEKFFHSLEKNGEVIPFWWEN